MVEVEFMEDVTRRFGEAYEFLRRNKRNLGYPASEQYEKLMELCWNAQSQGEGYTRQLTEKYAALAEALKNA